MNSFEDEFAKERPFLWHLTAAEHIDRIMERKCLDCAATPLRAAGCDELICKPRPREVTLCVNGEMIILRDHHESLRNHEKFTHGWTLEDYIEYLNGFVFFFPGDEKGPNDHSKDSKGYSKDFVKKYYCCEPLQKTLCIETEELFRANLGTPPQFSRCNSGAPSSSDSSRGPDTFMCGEKFKGRPSEAKDVVEVAFCCKVNLPHTKVFRLFVDYEDITRD